MRALPLRRLFRRMPRSLRWVGGVLLGLNLATVAWIAWPLPDEIANPGPVPSLVLQDRFGMELRATRAPDGSRGGWVSFDDVDPDLISAILAAEDRRYFRHHGVDVLAVGRAAWTNLREGRVVSGASTLTMQTSRLLRSMPRTWTGKVKQALWALRLEAHLSKARILEIYLNRVPLGQGAVGVASACRLYFDASPLDVSPAQAALLASIAHAPSRDNPLVDRHAARERRNGTLARMGALGFLDAEQLARALKEPVASGGPASRFLAPHFTSHLLARASDEGPRMGTLHTTLDLDLQRALEAEVRHTVDQLREKGVRHGALVALDNRTGGILAWVGSPDFWAPDDGQVDMVVSPRQPGSTLKPFLYGLAFDRGYSPATVLPDVPMSFATPTGPYRPQNYDRGFRGPVRIREALASSFNVPAVDMAHRVGTGSLLATLRAAGFESLAGSPEFYGLGLALGNGEITLLELANAYRGLALSGVRRPVHWLLEDVSPGGEGRIPSSEDDLRHDRFLSPGATALVLDILSDPVARIPGFGEETPFDLPFPAAAKTGTSRHFTDNWAVAVSAGFTVAVWVGNFDGRPMEGVSGVSGAGPLLYRSALEVAARYPPGYLPSPEQAGAVALPVCVLSGLRAKPGCASMIEWFLPGTEPTRVDDWETDGGVVLPPEYAEWAEQANSAEEVRVAGTLPSIGTEIGPPQNDGAPAAYTMVSPQDGDRYVLPHGPEAQYATIPLTAVGGPPGEDVTWYVDGEIVSDARWQVKTGVHTFKVVWSSGRSAQATIVVE